MGHRAKIVARPLQQDISFRKVIGLLAFCLLIICTFNTTCAETLPKIAKLLPGETVLLIEIDNFQQLEQQFKKTSFYKLYKDPAMAAFTKNLEAKWKEKVSQNDKEIFSALFNTDVLPQGRVAFALVLDEKVQEIDEPPVLFISQWGENLTKIKEAVEKVVKKAIEKGAHKKSEDYRRISIETIINEDKTSFSYAFVDDTLIGGVNVEVIKFVIAHIKGASSPTLADDTDYSSTISAVGPYHDINFYLNIKQVVKKIIAEDATEEVKDSMANLGLDNVVSMGCSIGLARTPKNSYHAKLIVKVEGTKKGICKMLETEPSVIRAPRFIPSDTSSVTFFNLDIKKAYSELAKIMSGFPAEYASILYMPLIPESPEGEPALYLRRDIIEYLGSQIIIAQSVDKPESSKLPTTEYIIALTINDSRALEKSMAFLHGKMMSPNNPEAKREFLGHTMYLFGPGALPFAGGGAIPMQGHVDSQMPKLAFTVTDTYIIFGTEAAVEKAIRTQKSDISASINSAKWFNKAKASIPSVTGLAVLEDDAASTEAFWSMMKKTNKVQGNQALSAVSPIQIDSLIMDMLDFSLLPDFDAVRKYFGISTLYGISREDGFFFECREINPEDSD
ncbi:MAG: hypothetical protein FVQ80_05155 [Planctomycetes bacterium]|nr:hypothetical protein [Planctomycetota bacterium]